MAAVEFSLILPILVLLWLGGVEVTQALSVDRRLNNLASSIGDLVARSKTVTYADIDQIFDIAPGAMFPSSTHEPADARLGGEHRRLAERQGRLEPRQWHRRAYTVNATRRTPSCRSRLRVANTQIIMSEVYYTYTPAVGYVISGQLAL